MNPSFEYLAASAHLAGDEETAKALLQAAKMREALSALYTLVVAMAYEPDVGKPHPVKDGIYDKIMRQARDAMPDRFEQTPGGAT